MTTRDYFVIALASATLVYVGWILGYAVATEDTAASLMRCVEALEGANEALEISRMSISEYLGLDALKVGP